MSREGRVLWKGPKKRRGTKRALKGLQKKILPKIIYQTKNK